MRVIVSDPKSDAHGGLRDLMECRDCGLFQRLIQVREGNVAACCRCGATLRKRRDNSASLACACTAAVLFVFALDMPLMTLRAAGRYSSATVFSGPAALDRFGIEGVGPLVLMTLVVFPAIKLLILIVALLGQRSGGSPRWLPWVFGWLERLNPWAMVEVFLLGVFVAYTRLRAIASVDIEPSLVALFGVMLTTAAADAALDPHAIWESLERAGEHEKELTDTDDTLIGCHVCGRVSWSREGASCRRCSHPLHRRKPNSVTRTWALLIAAGALYIPANSLSIMTVTRFGRGGPHTILGGVVQLFEDRLWPLAVVVLIASIFVPIAKIVGLCVMLVSTRRGSRGHLMGRARVFRVIAAIGRWSMIDVFAVSILVALVRMGSLANVVPEKGAMAFAAVVVLTMLATECFDPRIMWDAAGASVPERLFPVATLSPSRGRA